MIRVHSDNRFRVSLAIFTIKEKPAMVSHLTWCHTFIYLHKKTLRSCIPAGFREVVGPVARGNNGGFYGFH
jgi:hypothetical protein